MTASYRFLGTGSNRLRLTGTTVPLGTWTKQGNILTAIYDWEQGSCEETSVLGSGDSWQMWYRGGSSPPQVGYATASSPLGPWTRAEDPISALVGYWGTCVSQDGSGVYHFFGISSDWTTIDHWTSPDGQDWTLGQSSLFGLGASGSWDDLALGNLFAFEDLDGSCYLYYEAVGTGTWNRCVGVATATSMDGPWTKYAHNPIVGSRGIMAGRPDVHRIGSRYVMWCHGGQPAIAAGLPTDACRASGPSPLVFTFDAVPLVARSTEDEGVGESVGQIADVRVVWDDSQTYMIYTATSDGRGGGDPHQKIATAPGIPQQAS
jgi:hypothetical protein